MLWGGSGTAHLTTVGSTSLAKKMLSMVTACEAVTPSTDSISTMSSRRSARGGGAGSHEGANPRDPRPPPHPRLLTLGERQQQQRGGAGQHSAQQQHSATAAALRGDAEEKARGRLGAPQREVRGEEAREVRRQIAGEAVPDAGADEPAGCGWGAVTDGSGSGDGGSGDPRRRCAHAVKPRMTAFFQMTLVPKISHTVW